VSNLSQFQGGNTGSNPVGDAKANSPVVTSSAYCNAMPSRLDGNGCWRDNVFVERLWKTVKYEHVYLHAYDTVPEARAKLATYLEFYNRRRPHTALDGHTPDDLYFSSPQQQLVA